MSTYFIEGIILKHQNFRESDRLITVYTKEHGKLELISRGLRKIKSKLAGSLEPFFYVKMQIAKGKRIDLIASSEIVYNYKNIINNLEKVALVSFIFEILDTLTKVSQKDERIYSLLMEVMDIINKSKEIENIKRRIIWFFSWRILSLSGFKPELDKCLKCREKIDSGVHYFDYRSGGITCSKCQSRPCTMEDHRSEHLDESLKVRRVMPQNYSGKDMVQGKVKNKIPISNDLINIIKLIYKNEFGDLLHLKFENKTSQQLSKITFLFLKYHLEKELKSEKFLKVFKITENSAII